MKVVFTFLILIFVYYSLSAQEIKPMVITTSGVTMDQSDVNMSFTIGEITIKTISGTNNNIGQGFINSATASTAGTYVPKNVFTLYMDTVTGNTGQQVEVHIKVRNFHKILSMQGSITFDSSVLSFVQADNYGANGLSTSNFGTTHASSGRINFSWTDPTLSGTTLSNDTVLFAIRFNLIGQIGTFTPVNFSNQPTSLEFVDTSYTPIGILLEPGLVDNVTSVSLSGNIQTLQENGISTALVTAAGSPSFTKLTDTSGNYTLNLVAGDAYTLTPSKNNDSAVTNGVTTLDYLLIQRYILGTGTLNSPYQIIAADVNSSGSVTTLDLVYIKSLILGNIITFPGNKLWAFVPSNYVFNNPQNPFPFPSYLSYTNLTSQTNQNFIGMKLGDVNGSWNSHIYGPQYHENTVSLELPKLEAMPQTEISAPVTAKNFKNISGMQCTVEWDETKLEFIGIDTVQGGLSLAIEYGAGRAANGELSIAWTDPNYGSTTLVDDNPLFYLKYRVTGGIGDSSVLRITSALTPVEIVDKDLNVDDFVTLDGMVKIGMLSGIQIFNSVKQPILNSSPNPFNGLTKLSFELFDNAAVNIDIYDALGQELEQVNGSFEIGNHEIDLGNNWAEGVYFVRFKTSNYMKTIKVIKNGK